MLVILQLVLIRWLGFAGLKHFACLLGGVVSGAKLEESACKRGGGLVVLHFKEHVQGRSKRQNLVNGLEAAMSEVSSELAQPLLFFQRVLGQSLSVRFHLQTDDVLSSDVHQLLGFGDVLTAVNYEQWNVQNDVLELFNRFSELPDGCQLIAGLKVKYSVKKA